MTTICLDVGGSLYNKLPNMMRYVYETPYPFRLVAFDHNVRLVMVINEYADLRAATMSLGSIAPGGTDYMMLFELLEQYGNTDQAILYSDGGAVLPEKASFPVYWVAEFLVSMTPTLGEILP